MNDAVLYTILVVLVALATAWAVIDEIRLRRDVDQMYCTRCDGSGFINLDQVDSDVLAAFEGSGDPGIIFGYIDSHDTDCQVCDCCGNGDTWHGSPGEHNNFRGEGATEPFPECI